MRKFEINKYDYILNSLLDKGLYLEDKEQLIFFVKKYMKFNKKNSLTFVDEIQTIRNDSRKFVEWIKVKYGVNESIN